MLKMRPSRAKSNSPKSVPHAHELKKGVRNGVFLEDLGFAGHSERVGNGDGHGFGKSL